MSTKFEIQKDAAAKASGGEVHLKISGAIDEDASFPFDLIPADGSSLVLNLAGVSLINSCGIRSWVKWIKGIPESTKLVLYDVPKIVVDQINMVDGFVPINTQIESFYVPYFCDACEEVTQVLYKAGKHYLGKDLKFKEPVACQKCKGETEIDVLETKYFKFLSTL